MEKLGMGRKAFGLLGHGTALGLMLVLLAACQMQEGGSATTRLVERDVEAPEILDFKEAALWDGQASSGGIWASSARAKAPQRVLLRNEANGKFVIGSLFPRAAANGLQISGDAAGALGLGPNQKADLRVTALRPESGSAAPLALPATPILDRNIQVAAFEGGTETIAPAQAAAPMTAAPQVAAPPSPAEPKGSTIQIGFFSVEENAKRASAMLAKAGITANIRQETLRGKSSWVVTARGNGDKLNQIRAAGFADAYMLK